MRITNGRTLLISLVLVLGSLGATALTGTAGTGPGYEQFDETVESFDGTNIDINVCKPDGATATHPVPLILHSHGWGGSASDCDSFTAWFDAGFAVVSISQRGFGDSEGEAHVHDPHFEGKDNIAVIDFVAQYDWIKTTPSQNGLDPVMGAIGGSYGGGYQLITALTEINNTGTTRLDALAPEITWYDLPQSLAPNGVVRSVWVDALYAAGAANVHDGIHQAYAYSLTTGQLPDGTVPGVYNIDQDFYGNSPVWFADHGKLLDIPVVLRQGITDNLFNLNQAVDNFENVLTQDARDRSIVIGYNGGHALPNVLPMGTMASGDPCTTALGFDSFTDLRIELFTHLIDGAATFSDKSYHLATDEGTCVSTDSVEGNTPTTPALDPIVLPQGAGAPLYLELTSGEQTIAGIPTFHAQMTSAGVDSRAFLALAVGTSPADAQVLSNNVMPVQTLLPGVQQQVDIDMAGVATTLEQGESLYLVVTPTSDMFVHHGSRTPGGIVFQDVTVDLPVVG